LACSTPDPNLADGLAIDATLIVVVVTMSVGLSAATVRTRELVPCPSAWRLNSMIFRD
jgi:hypothetical protein